MPTTSKIGITIAVAIRNIQRRTVLDGLFMLTRSHRDQTVHIVIDRKFQNKLKSRPRSQCSNLAVWRSVAMKLSRNSRVPNPVPPAMDQPETNIGDLCRGSLGFMRTP